jgi:general stress protein YciG
MSTSHKHSLSFLSLRTAFIFLWALLLQEGMIIVLAQARRHASRAHPFTLAWRSFAMTKKRGFASMDATRQREIASKGGRAAHEKGTAHEFTPEEAREAGRKGGQAAHSRGTAHRFTSEEAREAGRKGGRKPRV